MNQGDKRYKEAKECLYAKHQREMLYLKIKEGTGIMVFPYINIIFFIHYIEMLIDGKVIYTTEGSIQVPTFFIVGELIMGWQMHL